MAETQKEPSPNPLSIEENIAVFRTWNREDCHLAVENLGKIGKPAVPQLLAVLGDDTISYWAILALEIIKDPETIEPLITVMRNDADGELGFNVAYTLASIGQEAVPALISTLNEGLEPTRSNATTALALLKCKEAVPAILNFLNDALAEDNFMSSPVAINALGEIGSLEALAPLLSLLENKNQFVRPHAILALGEIGDTRAVEPILKFLQSAEIYERLFAARALGNLGDSRALPLLNWVTQNDEGMFPDGDKVKNEALKAIAQIKQSEVP